MNLLEIVDERNKKVDELKTFTDKVKVEMRKMNDEEEQQFKNLKNEVEKLNKQIEDIKAEDEKSVRMDYNKKNNDVKMNTNFSLLKTIRSIVERKGLNEETLEIINAGKRAFAEAGQTSTGDIVLPLEKRAEVLAGTATAGQEVVGEDKFNLLTALYANTVLGQAGATFYTGLRNDVSIPTYDGTTCYWGSEVAPVTGGTGAFGEVTLSPKRLTAQISISKQFLAQDSINAEAALMQDLNKAILVKLENTIFDENAAVAGIRPAGLFYGADYAGTLSGATSYAKLIGMKAAVDTSNALMGNLAYVTNPTLASVFETTSTDTGSGIFCMQNGRVGGYPVYVTSNIPSGKVAFGNWADYVVGQWGGIDITVDPYSKAGEGKIVITANTYWDFKPVRTASFKLNRLS